MALLGIIFTDLKKVNFFSWVGCAKGITSEELEGETA